MLAIIDTTAEAVINTTRSELASAGAEVAGFIARHRVHALRELSR